MMRRLQIIAAIMFLSITGAALADGWTRFRGDDGAATSAEKVPVKWSADENINWRVKLPGPGTSSPIITGGKIFLTSYSGYGTESGQGDMGDLRFHVVCVDRNKGKTLWTKTIMPKLPEQRYGGYMELHGYTSSTPATDGKYVYVFLGKTGVFCFDLDGNQKWSTSVGDGKHGWGSATSPVLYKNLVIVNASVESRSIVALDKATGKEVWRTGDITSSWSTPLLVKTAGGTELVVSASQKIFGFDPDNGKELWHADSFNWYVCPSVIANDGVIYTLQNSTCVAVKAGGRGDVTESHTVWQKRFGTTVSSLVYHDGHVYFSRGAQVVCLNAKNGEEVYKKNLSPRPRTVYASPIVAGGKIYYVSQNKGTFVLSANAKFEQLAHNTFKDDDSRTNASPIVDNGCLLMRTDRYLYCIGKNTSQ